MFSWLKFTPSRAHSFATQTTGYGFTARVAVTPIPSLSRSTPRCVSTVNHARSKVCTVTVCDHLTYLPFHYGGVNLSQKRKNPVFFVPFTIHRLTRNNSDSPKQNEQGMFTLCVLYIVVRKSRRRRSHRISAANSDVEETASKSRFVEPTLT